VTRHDRKRGWTLLRIPVRDRHGRVRDAHEAAITFAGRPYARDVEYLGCSWGWHVFQRPPLPELSLTQILAPIERYRR
jgi:hypothetical protein